MRSQLVFTDSTSTSYNVFLDQEIIKKIIENKDHEKIVLRFCSQENIEKEFEVKFTKEGSSYYSDSFTDEENFVLNQIIENIISEYKNHSKNHQIEKSPIELLLFK